MLMVLCLIVRMTYRRFCLFALAILVLYFIGSPAFNYTQLSVFFFFSEACTSETSELLNVAWCNISCACEYFTSCLMPTTETYVFCVLHLPRMSRKWLFPSDLETKSICCWWCLLLAPPKLDFPVTLLHLFPHRVFMSAQWNLLHWQWLINGLVHITEYMPTRASSGIGKNIHFLWYLTQQLGWHRCMGSRT